MAKTTASAKAQPTKRKRLPLNELDVEIPTPTEPQPNEPKRQKRNTHQIPHDETPAPAKAQPSKRKRQEQAPKKREVPTGMTRPQFKAYVQDRPDLALDIFNFHDAKSGTRTEWCMVLTTQQNKAEKGCNQISYSRYNKFMTMQELGVSSTGRRKSDGERCSRVCGNSACYNPGHLAVESFSANSARKGCRKWQYCPHPKTCGSERHLVCQHEPPCIKYEPGFDDHKDFMARGVTTKPCKYA